MSKFKRNSLLILIFSLCCGSLWAQSNDIDRQPQVEVRREVDRIEAARSNRVPNALLNEIHRDDIRFPVRNSIRLSKEEKARINGILAPNAEDTEKYRTFLSQKNTGLIRLFPDYNCKEKHTIRVDGNCADLVEDSWNYSFRQKKYQSYNLEDLGFKDGNFVSRSFFSQGILVNLGDIPLESLTTADDGLKFLNDFKPAKKIEEAKAQFKELSRGIEADGRLYTNSVKADESTTYILRSIAYRPPDLITYYVIQPKNNEGAGFFILNDDKRIDITIAFRIVRKDPNGSVTILWKELSRQTVPKIDFAKNEKFEDFK